MAVAAEWNVIVTLPEATFREARKFLRQWGVVHRTAYFHVLTLTVDNVEGFLAEVAKAIEEKPGTLNILSHIIPAQRTFTFASAEEFEAKARDIAILWAPMLAGKSFHVRLHRRGFKGTLSTPKEERFLDETLLTRWRLWAPLAGSPSPIPMRSCRSRPSMAAPGFRSGSATSFSAMPFSACRKGT